MAYSLEEINRRVLSDPQGFVNDCDREGQSRVEEAAEKIIANIPNSPIVLLAGPSGSGKTTTARKVEAELEKRGVNTIAVAMDNYFKTLDPETAPRTEKGDIDFESPLCMDMELMNEHFEMLSRGEEIKVPHFIFSRQKRSTSEFTPLRIGKNEVAIFEGIHAFNDEITNAHPEAFNLYISANSRITKGGEDFFRKRWMRMMRRIVRDDKFRGTSAETTLKLWGNVVASEEKNMFPNVYKADMRVDSALAYEVPLMKKFAMPLLKKLPEGKPWTREIPELMAALGEFEELDERYVGPESLIREFIGGGIYNY